MQMIYDMEKLEQEENYYLEIEELDRQCKLEEEEKTRVELAVIERERARRNFS